MTTLRRLDRDRRRWNRLRRAGHLGFAACRYDDIANAFRSRAGFVSLVYPAVRLRAPR
jgi:hypothetical protein